jgi:nitrogen-specific signal transduction histidine kinase
METALDLTKRAPQDEIRRQYEKLAALPLVSAFLDAVPDMVMVLNGDRQIIFANRAFANFLRLNEKGQPPGTNSGGTLDDSPAPWLGRRPGEALGCIRSDLMEGGCGTAPFCRACCGAAIAIHDSQKRHAPEVQECRIICGQNIRDETSLDLRVWARPMEISGESYTVFSVVDISDEKRRQALERIFFHDVINTAGCVKGLADAMILDEMTVEESRKTAGLISETADQLLEEIGAQKMLSDAERGDLKLAVKTVQSKNLLTQNLHQFHNHSLAKNKTIVVDPAAEAFVFVSDPVLLRRVLINLVKNALESAAVGETVTLSAFTDHDGVGFTVHNPAVIPPEVQRQIFSRSYSTKGIGRGLGTYSIKLLTEKYLHGQVSFVSTPSGGTRFTIRYPQII